MHPTRVDHRDRGAAVSFDDALANGEMPRVEACPGDEPYDRVAVDVTTLRPRGDPAAMTVQTLMTVAGELAPHRPTVISPFG